ncbi:MAG: hypothetical protein HY304_04035 [candidate division Zixibacteria bacterium]|nr:hypothetical protein [candidate division Zixibacteria bacterium]
MATGSSYADIVKITNIVVDQKRRRAYFAASLSRYLGVVDIDSLRMIGTIDCGVDGFVSRHLALNPGTGILYMFVIETSRLYRIDPVSGSVSAPITVGGLPAFDTSANRLYLSESPDKVRIYDDLLNPVDLISGVTAPGDLFVDSAQGKLYVVNAFQPPQAGVSVYSIATKAFLRKYDMPAGFDGKPKHIHVAGGKIYVNGATLSTYSVSVLDETNGTGTLYSMSENGQGLETYGGKLYQMTGYPYYAGYLPAADGSHGVLEVRDALSGSKITEIQTDLESLYFDIDQTTGRLFYTATGRSTIGVLRLSDDTLLGTIDVATTIEDVLVHPADGSLYLRNRLGGSTIYRVDPGAGTLTNTLNPGNWPTKIILDAGRSRLYALSHYEAKISVYDLSTDALVGTIPLGTQRARTDALSTMVMDRSLGKLYAVIPELGTLTAVNADGSGSPLTITIDGFTPNPNGGGPGKLQIAVNESLGRVFLFNTDAKRLNIYDGSTLALLSYSTISGYNLTAPPLDLLFSDDAGGRLFVGPHIVNPTTGAVTGSLPTGKKVIGLDPGAGRIYLWDIITPGFFERVYEYDLNLSGVLRQWDFSPVVSVYSAFGFDFARGKMYVGYFDRGVLDVVDLGSAPCVCPCHADPQCDSVVSDVLDVTNVVNVAFRGADAAVKYCDPCAQILSAASH